MGEEQEKSGNMLDQFLPLNFSICVNQSQIFTLAARTVKGAILWTVLRIQQTKTSIHVIVAMATEGIGANEVSIAMEKVRTRSHWIAACRLSMPVSWRLKKCECVLP